MFSKKNRQTKEPIISTVHNRNINTATTKSKRSVSLRPLLSCKIAPTAPINLPPIKSTLPLHNIRHDSTEPTKKTIDCFDDRVFGSKAKAIKKQAVASKASVGLSKEALFQRKQSHLNTYFNQRKNRLKEITHENKRIYMKINSQKSLYSSRQLNKSFDSNCELSRRLSNSKLSRASSRQSNTSRAAKKAEPRKQKEIKIESLSINHVQDNQIERYLNIFCNNGNMKRNSTEKKFSEGSRANVDGQENKTLQPLHLDFNQGNKENKGREASKLERIVEQFNQRTRRRNNLILARLL